MRAAQGFLGADFTRGGHHRRPGDEHLRHAFDEQRIMRHHLPPGAEPGNRAKAKRHHRHIRHIVDHDLPAGDLGYIGVTHRFQRTDRAATAGAFDHADEGQAILARQPFGIRKLSVQAGVRRAAAHGEIIGGEHHRPAIDGGATEQEIGGLEAQHFAGVGIGGKAGERADLAERSFIGDRGKALAGIHPPQRRLFFQFGIAAHLQRRIAPQCQFIDFGLPGHMATLSARDGLWQRPAL